MRSARLVAVVIIGGLLAVGLLLDAGDDPAPVGTDAPEVVPGVAMPVAQPEPTLTSTWFCAAGTAAEDGFADHVVLIANPTDRPRTATITALAGTIAPAPSVIDESEGTTTTGATTTTEATTTTQATTTSTVPPEAPTVSVDVPAQSVVPYKLRELVDSPLAGAVVEVEGGEVAVEHEVSGRLGRATAPCSTTAAADWSLPWGVTSRGTRDLLVFMNPFPDDATVDISFATDEGARDTPVRFRGFPVPGRSVVGAYIDQDVTRREQVSAQVRVRAGRVVVDRIQTFNGTGNREGMTLGLGAPSPALSWIFPDGRVGTGLTQQIVVYNSTDQVAEVEVEVRLEDPDTNGTPEPFELTVPPSRYSIVNLHDEDRMPAGVSHSTIVRSLNGVPVAAERVVTSAAPNSTVGVSATLGAPLAAPTWVFPGGGVTDERDEWITLFNASTDEQVTVTFTGLANGNTIALQDLQGLTIEPGGRLAVRLSDSIGNRASLPVVVAADGPIVAERGLYRVGGRGISLSMGIPLAVDVFIPDPVEG